MSKAQTVRFAVLLSFMSMLLARLASAQVNVEPLRQELHGDGMRGHLAESISSFEGNARGVVVGLRFLVGGKVGPYFGYLSTTADYMRMAGAIQMAKAFAHIRNNYELKPWLWVELFGQVETDRFRYISLRELVGAGPRFGLIQWRRHSLYFGTAYMLEYTRLTLADATVRPPALAQRSSNYLAFTWMIEHPIVLSEVVYFEPRFDAPKDYHALSVSSLEFSLTPRLSSRIDITTRYDSRQLPQTKQYDIGVRNMLDLRF